MKLRPCDQSKPMRPQRIAAALALIFGSSPIGCMATTLLASPALGQVVSTQAMHQPAPQSLQFGNCNDGGAGSLRDTIASAAEGATISASALTCSTITLTTGALFVNQNNLTIEAANSANTRLTIDGGNNDRVIFHTGSGLLSVTDAIITNGTAGLDTGTVVGGCVWSTGSLQLDFVDVTSCTLTTRSGTALGGGIYAAGTLGLTASTVSGNLADALDGGTAKGGGVYAKQGFNGHFSTLTHNTAKYASTNGQSSGGGLFTPGVASIDSCTIDNNKARFGAGVYFGGPGSGLVSRIINSTISSNTAKNSGGGLSTSQPLQIYNSTIAFNIAQGFGGGGMYLGNGGIPVPLTIDSTIVANNSAPSAAVPGADICCGFSASGSGNLVMSATHPLPGVTISVDPQLQPLRDNGGYVATHALLPTSPAIDHGNNVTPLRTDERGRQRVVGPAADIGAFEWQGPGDGDTIFANGFEQIIINGVP